MIVKIVRDKDSYIRIIDNVRDIEIEDNGKEWAIGEAVYSDILIPGDSNLVGRNSTGETVVQAGTTYAKIGLHFDNGWLITPENYKVLIITQGVTAYVCNDEGKTVDTIRVR